MRIEFSQKVKVQAFERSEGRCEICTAKLFTGNIEYDHAVPCGLGGEATLENCYCVCKNCHRGKTSTEDIPRISKAKRNFRKAHGIRKPSRFACSRDSKFKKKIGGAVVLR